MNNISYYISVANFILLSLVFISLLVKIFLYYKVEKEWDPIRFIHFSKIDLKMTVRKDLRIWRKRQNLLTNIFLILILLFGISYFFRMLNSI